MALDIRMGTRKGEDVLIFSNRQQAVALSYRTAASSAPTVIGMWKGKDADQVIRLAKSTGIPSIENNELAEKLCESATVDEEIPQEFYEAVATILAAFWRDKEAPSQRIYFDDDHLHLVEAVEVNIGYELISLVDRDQMPVGNFLERLENIRKRLVSELGCRVPTVRIRDDLKLPKNKYIFKMRGVRTEGDFLHPDRLLAIRSQYIDYEPDGISCLDPVHRHPSLWILPDQRDLAIKSGYYVCDPVTAMATHMSEFMTRHAAAFLTSEQMQELLDKAKEEDDLLVTMVLDRFGFERIQRLFRDLLTERIPLVDVMTILDALVRSDGADLLAAVRRALAPSICSELMGDGNALHVVPLTDKMEQSLCNLIRQQDGAPRIIFDTVREREEFNLEMAKLGETLYPEIVFEVRPPELRRPFFNLVNACVPKYFRKCFVLGAGEIPIDISVQTPGGARRDLPHAEPRRTVNLPKRLLSNDDIEYAKRVMSEWTDTFANAVTDEVALFDALADFYDIHGKRPPADIVYCAHPTTPLIAASAALEFHKSHIHDGSCGRDHASMEQIRMSDFNLLHNIGFRGTPVRFLYSKHGRKSPLLYLNALEQQVMETLNTNPHIRAAHELFDSLFIAPLGDGFERVSEHVHDSELFRNSVHQATERALRPLHLRFDSGLIGDVKSLTAMQTFFCYWDLKRLMGNYILFSVLYDRHVTSDGLDSFPERAEMDLIKKEADCLKRFYTAGGWTFLATEHTAFVVTRPKRIELNPDTGRLHSTDGPAAVLSDGMEIYRYRGMIVPPAVVNAPSSMTVESILKEENAEIRRVMIARKGLAAFIREAGPKVLNEDCDPAGNPRKLYRIELAGDEPIVVVHVIDPAKKRLGLDPDVFLRVPPGCVEARHAAKGKLDAHEVKFWEDAGDEIKTCAHAVAWTFRSQLEDYAPIVET